MGKITKKELEAKIKELEAVNSKLIDEVRLLNKENGELKGRLSFYEDCTKGINKFCEDVGKSVGMFFSGEQKK